MCFRDKRAGSNGVKPVNSRCQHLQSNCLPIEWLSLIRSSRSSAKGVSRHSKWLKMALTKVYPKITALLWAFLPQVDGSPALQSLVICLYFITSGTATDLVKRLYMQASAILVGQGPLFYDR